MALTAPAPLLPQSRSPLPVAPQPQPAAELAARFDGLLRAAVAGTANPGAQAAPMVALGDAMPVGAPDATFAPPEPVPWPDAPENTVPQALVALLVPPPAVGLTDATPTPQAAVAPAEKPRAGRRIATDAAPSAPLPDPVPQPAAVLALPPQPVPIAGASGPSPVSEDVVNPPPAHLESRTMTVPSAPRRGVVAVPTDSLGTPDQTTTPVVSPDVGPQTAALAATMPPERGTLPATVERPAPGVVQAETTSTTPRVSEPAQPQDMNIVMTLHATSSGFNGAQRLTLKLNPTDLGTVSFDIRVPAEGGRSVALVFERAETMAMFYQDRQHLETALARAGLQADPGQISFTLAPPPTSAAPGPPSPGSDQAGVAAGFADTGSGQPGRGESAPARGHSAGAAGEPWPPDAVAAISTYRLALRAGLDILA